MQLVRSFERQHSAQVGFGIRTMLLSAEDRIGPITKRLAGLGSVIEHATEMFASLEAMINDPADYGLFVLDCDAFDGIEAGKKAVCMLSAVTRSIPSILISRECKVQVFSEERAHPTILRSPLTAVSLRVGFEHALRDRLAIRIF